MKTVNLEDVCIVERIGPSYSDFTFKLKFYGKTPGGKDLAVIVSLPVWGTDEIAQRLHEVVKEQQRQLVNILSTLKGEA